MAMSADNDRIPEPTIFSAVLTPHRSLSRKGFLIFMMVVGSVSFAAAARKSSHVQSFVGGATPASANSFSL